MKPQPIVRIPKPCHEDWQAMKKESRSRFCNACEKSVIDFTGMSTSEIISHLNENSQKSSCGRFLNTQVQTVEIKIPVDYIPKKISFTTSFIVALLLVMGTTLLSCTDQHGNKTPITTVEIISDNNIDSSENERTPVAVMGEPVPEVMGIMTPYFDEDTPRPYPWLDTPPEFQDTPNALNENDKKEYFTTQIKAFVRRNFDTVLVKTIQGTAVQRIYTQFTISKIGTIENVQIRAPHPDLEKETKRVISLLPQFRPGKHEGENCDVLYSLPILIGANDL